MQSCISEAQKYQKLTYRPEKKKGKGKGKDKDTDTTKPNQNHQDSQNENDGNGIASHNGNVKSAGAQSGALNRNSCLDPGEGHMSQSEEQKEVEKDKDKDKEAKEHEATKTGKTEEKRGDEKREETRAMKNAKEKGDKKRKRKSNEADASEGGEGSADKSTKPKKRKKGEEQEGEIKKQPKSKKSKNIPVDTKKPEEQPSVPPVSVPSPERSHKHHDSSIPSTTVNENIAHQPLATLCTVLTAAELPPSQALSSHHFLDAIPTGKEISVSKLVKKLKRNGSESEVWEFLKRAKVTKDKADKVALVLP